MAVPEARAARSLPRRRSAGGFTLLEMVVAVAIFAVIGAMSYATLDHSLATRDRLESRNQEISRLQRTIARFERDMRFMTHRPVRDRHGEVLPALWSISEGAIDDGDLMELTVSLPSYRSPHWQRLQRVGWSIVDGRLIRREWAVLDRDTDSEPRNFALLEGVHTVELVYFGRDQERGGVESRRLWEDARSLPLGVELIITLRDETVYRRIVEVSGGTI